MYFLFLQIHSIFSILIFLFTLTNFSGTVHSRKGKKKKEKNYTVTMVSISLCWSDTGAGYHEKQQTIVSLKSSK